MQMRVFYSGCVQSVRGHEYSHSRLPSDAVLVADGYVGYSKATDVRASLYHSPTRGFYALIHP